MPQGIGRIDGKYRVLAQLGQGGSADVSLAVAHGPSGFNKLVVLKAMKASLREEPELARMLLNEARLAARLNHPNIVQTNEVFEFDGLPVIVMEYLEGQSLASVIARAQGFDKLTLAMRLRIVSEALSGLHYSHELSDFDGSPLELVHRDMSPHNVFVTFDGQVKILDFGIAKILASQVQTATGVIKGKLDYMPAEQITNEGVDRRADLYAVGVMLWEIAAGRRMWLGEPDGVIMDRVLNGELPRLGDVAAVDAELERIVSRALALEPADRYATALEMQAELDAFIQKTAPAVSLREIGAVVAELFADVRAQTRRLIDMQLSREPAFSTTEHATALLAELQAGTHSGFTAGSRSDVPKLEESKSARPALIVALAAAVALVVLAALWPRPDTPVVGVATVASARELERVRVRLTVFPAQARLYIDDEPAPSNPYAREFQRQPARTLKVRAEADEHRTEVREIVLDRDVDAVLVLQRIASKTAPSVEVEAEAEPPPPPRAPPVRRNDECSPPFWVDANGVKKFKAQCL